METTLTVNTLLRDLTENRISLDSLEVSWAEPRSFRFSEHTGHHRASFGVEDVVVLRVDGTARFRGRVKRVDLDGEPNAERVVYTCLGLRECAKDIGVRDPASGIPRVVFNAPADDDDYDPSREGRTVGQIVAWLIDEHADELRAAGVIPDAPATGTVQAELDALDVVPPKVVFDSLDLDAALDEVMTFQRGHRFVIDPDTRTFRFRHVVELPATTITYNSADKALRSLLRPSTLGRATAVEIVGPPQPVNQVLKLSENGLTRLWNAALEADWTWDKGHDPANDNTYGYVYRRFQITEAARRRIGHGLGEPEGIGDHVGIRCPQVYRETPAGAWVWVPAMFDLANGVVMLAQPATVGDERTAGAASCAGDLCLLCSYLSDPLTARHPASGFEGTAYTQPANPVQVVRRIYDEDFTLSAQLDGRRAVAAQRLEATKDIVYAGTVTLGHVDWSLAGLAYRVDVTGRDDAGEPVETGFESLGAIPLTVSFDLARGRTALTLSTDASPFTDARIAPDVRLRELETQARRNERYRSLHRCQHGPTPRAGNDGEPGSETRGRGQWLSFVLSSYPARLGPWTEWLHVPGVAAYRTDAGEIELPAGRVTRVRAVFASDITAGAITITPHKGSAADSRADVDTDAWTAYAVPAGSECELAPGTCSRRVDGWCFEIAEGETLGLKADASSDFEADSGTWLYARLWLEER
jgi:hypothetical protein